MPNNNNQQDASIERAGIETKKTFCRFCLSCCAMDVDVNKVTGEALALRGDPQNVLSGGYTCLRGRELINIQQHPDRITGALKRVGDKFVGIPLAQALDEIASKSNAILEQRGGRALATYNGSWAWSNLPTLSLSKAFHRTIKSPSMFAPTTLDQPAKAFMPARFGIWAGGIHTFKDADVVMFIGNNALVSQYAPPGGLPPYNPSRRLQDALNQSLNLIVIDPRRTEVARKATLHLQLRPGEDPTLLAGIIREILQQKLHDAAFCEHYVGQLEQLGRSVEPFTLEYVSSRTDVEVKDIRAAAELFAKGRVGAASTGTGPEMAPRGSLTEHLVMVLNAICGRYYREGESPHTAPPLSRPRSLRSQVVFPPKAWAEGRVQSRFRDLGALYDEMPCNVLADEILTPGEEQIRALFCIGGNPVVAFPNQEKISAAMDDLELLVCIDPWMSATSKRAHYIIGPKVMLEREDASMLGEMYFEEAYSHYTPAIVPARGETIEEWEFIWEIAARMGVELNVHGQTLSDTRRPTKYEITELLTAGSSIPLSEVKEKTAQLGGQIFPAARQTVKAAKEGNNNRFQCLPDDVEQELEVVFEEFKLGSSLEANAEFTHLLISRRIKQFFNSSGHNLPNLRRKGVTNYAYINPDDLRNLNIDSESLIEIRSSSGAISGVARASDDLKPGVISMAHAFGDDESDAKNVRKQGSSTNRLVSDEQHFDPITGQARQSAIPVAIKAL